jgi:adenylate kinase family enzyme
MTDINRVIVVGNSVSGKTTVALAMAERLGLAHLELDSAEFLDPLTGTQN